MADTTAGQVVATPGAKVVVYDLATGAAVERWPIDARELVASGSFGWAPPELDVAPVHEDEHEQEQGADGGDAADETPAIARRRR